MLILVIILSSCSGFGGKGGRRSGTANENFRTGTDGLVMRFLDNAPPPKQYDEEPLNALIELHNDGATNIQDGGGTLYLSGFDPSLITGVETTGTRIGDLEGRDFDFPDGGFDVINFQANVRDLRQRNIERYEPTLLVTACYDYETIANPEVCIDGDPYSINFQQKVCSSSEVNNFGGDQGAPVAVTKVSVEAAPRKSRFDITVENVGEGLAFQPGGTFLDKCSPYHDDGLDHNDINLVLVEEVKLGNVDIKTSCKPLEQGNLLRIKSDQSGASGAAIRGSGIMRCELSGITQPAFTSPLRIKLAYGYRDSIQKDIQIIQIP